MRPETGHARTSPLAGLRVLVVDDDRLPRRFVSVALMKAGADPVEAEDGTSALELCSGSARVFDAVVMDFVMPGLDGADLVQALRAVGFEGPVIGLTGAASEAQSAAWVAYGCDEVLPKGCSMTELVTELAAAYRRRRNGFGRRFR